MRISCVVVSTLLLLTSLTVNSHAGQSPSQALFRSVDLDVGEEVEVTLSDGSTTRLKLLEKTCERDNVRGAVRKATVTVEVNGERVELVSAMYRLPQAIGTVWIDCEITSDYLDRSSKSNAWALDKDARIRLWPKGSPWIEPGEFCYPTPTLRWFSSDTQMANDPCYVDAGERASNRNIYYHYGLDIGGAEAMVPVVAATDGLVISAGEAVMEGFVRSGTQVAPRADVVYIVDARGWHYRYSHLHSIDEKIVPGETIRGGERIGMLGKEGASGGWAHLHFGISSPQPSGRYGALEAYCLLWQAYQELHPTPLVAVARPHVLIAPGETAVLDAMRSWSNSSAPLEYLWTFTDGSTADGPIVNRVYDTPGTYSEVLQVTDVAGRIDYDFAVVQVVDPSKPDQHPPSIHAVYYPQFDLRVGATVTFKVRSFAIAADDGHEIWDFGDGSPQVVVRSDGCQKALNPDGYAITTHVYQKPGHYLVKVRRTNSRGETAWAHSHLHIAE